MVWDFLLSRLVNVMVGAWWCLMVLAARHRGGAATGLAMAGWLGPAWGPAALMIKVAVLVLFSHHGFCRHDWSSSIWPSTCSGTVAGDLARDTRSVRFWSCKSISAYKVLRA
jgi:hypothetical protein